MPSSGLVGDVQLARMSFTKTCFDHVKRSGSLDLVRRLVFNKLIRR